MRSKAALRNVFIVSSNNSFDFINCAGDPSTMFNTSLRATCASVRFQSFHSSLKYGQLMDEVPGRSALEIKILLKSRPSDPRYNIVTRFTFGMSASDSTFLSVMI